MAAMAMLLTLATGCAAPSSYYGIDLTAPTLTDDERAIQSLASRAQAGDKQAQLDLGIRFEEGRGVARDLKTARKLYERAAKDSGGLMWVYSPPVGNGSSGRVVPLNTGVKQVGLAEAKSLIRKYLKHNSILRFFV
ncbi:hypothetical protein [Alterisphingorhabdus coralli]|uniref:Sel1 repeat family protein n=1 Tax=Alterisphingorhabdus coralli TaxID=3071408 RepID=A0AA97F7M2_9SPHN|nr:hypothetical protein [Parasphingorhabdus sp. SCSIO 66989]WOE74577.1 hypothetical protein RB602_12070 [Parasphingorhabdus sp. SCSIO 66989]